MRLYRGPLQFKGRPPAREPQPDNGLYTWIEPALSEHPGGIAHLNQQIRSLRETYSMVEGRLKLAVQDKAMLASEAAELLCGLLDARASLENLAMSEVAATAKVRRKKIAA